MSAPSMPTAARMNPNRNDYAKIVETEDGQWTWEVYAGNHYKTHQARKPYTREANAKRALLREHPGIRIVS